MSWIKYDITMCDRADCPKARSCHRYLTYLDAVADGEPRIYLYDFPKEQTLPCDHYWEEEKQ